MSIFKKQMHTSSRASSLRFQNGFTLYPRASSLHAKRGFTLIEIMVSISIFAVIMVTGIGALLTITRSYETSREESIVSNSIHFAMDSMARDLRIGDSYYAGAFPSSEGSFLDEYRYNDAETTRIINFAGIDSRGYIRYTFEPGGGGPYLMRRQVIPGQQPIDSPLLTDFDNIEITNALFRVVGSEPGDDIQPSVFIYIRGEDSSDGSDFVLQTLVSQRNLDIES